MKYDVCQRLFCIELRIKVHVVDSKTWALHFHTGCFSVQALQWHHSNECYRVEYEPMRCWMNGYAWRCTMFQSNAAFCDGWCFLITFSKLHSNWKFSRFLLVLISPVQFPLLQLFANVVAKMLLNIHYTFNPNKMEPLWSYLFTLLLVRWRKGENWRMVGVIMRWSWCSKLKWNISCVYCRFLLWNSNWKSFRQKDSIAQVFCEEDFIVFTWDEYANIERTNGKF